MTTPARKQHAYDHRLKRIVHHAGNTQPAQRLGVPESTARGWIKSAPSRVVSDPRWAGAEVEELARRVLELEAQIARLRAVLRLLLTLVRVFGLNLKRRRVAEGRDKEALIRATEESSKVLGQRKSLRVLTLSPSRYHAWKREAARAGELGVECALTDRSSCPRTNPHQLTPSEIRQVENMVTAPEFRHVPTGALSVLAQRTGRVFASPTTWRRLVKEHGWRRPRVRIHPETPQVGIRASRPDEIWHIDTTLLRLPTGKKVYLHAVIDNFSRRLLAWRVADKLEPASTVAILLDASRRAENQETTPVVITDGGGENINRWVNQLIDNGLIERRIAQTDIQHSNSMIESWFRSLKHQWLFLHSLDSLTKIESLVEFYVKEHNDRIPHAAFRGQTPSEIYFGGGTTIPDRLERGRKRARRRRLIENRATRCSACREGALD